MKTLRFYLKTLLCLLAVGLSGLASATSVYNAGTGLSFTPGGLSNSGVVVGSTVSTSSPSPTGCSGSACSYTQTIDYYLTGANASSASQISTMTTTISGGNSEVSSASGDYAISTNTFGYYLSSPIETGSTNPSPSTCKTGCAITSPIMSFVPSSTNPALPTSSVTTDVGSTFVGVNHNGIIAGNGDFAGSDVPMEGIFGDVVNTAAGTMTLFKGTVTGLSSTNYVSVTDTSPTSADQAQLLTPTNTFVNIANLGYGAQTGGVNSTGQVVGTVYTGPPLASSASDGGALYANGNYYYGRAMLTGTNGSGTEVFGTANGVSSVGTAVNSSGQIGGYVVLSTGQTEAFISTAHGGLLVGIGAGALTDSTQVSFLNDYGQAIIFDSTTGMDYLYSAGVVVPLSSLISGFAPINPCSAQGFTCYTQQVVGFNNSGDILLNDPTLYSPTSSTSLSSSSLSTVSGATSLTSTSTYESMSTAQGGATPSSSFYTDPSTSTGSGSLQTAGVPDPAISGLLLLAVLGVAGLRRRKTEVLPA